MNKYTFNVSGTHCASCKILIEDIVPNSKVDLKKEIIEVESEKNAEELLLLLNGELKNNGYIVSFKKNIQKENDNTIWTAIPVGLGFLILFFLLQKSGILNLGIGGTTTPVTAFIIGLIASLSSCLAIVGGLILSLSTKISQDENAKTSKRQFVLFHAGRLLGFAVLGGVLGFIGKAIGVSFIFSAILGLLASIVMIMLGLNLVGVFKKNKVTLPSNIFGFFRKVEHATLAPIIIGIGTFFLPCGFTQSMQVAALGSGTFTSGFLIMLAFAFGTLPVLSLLSFGSMSFAHSKYAPVFFKSAGIVVIGLGFFALLGGLAGIGIINPLFNI